MPTCRWYPPSTRSKEPCGTAPPSGGSSRSSLFGKMKGAFDRARGSPDTPTAVQRSGSLEGSMDGEPVIIDRIAALPQKAVEAIVSIVYPDISCSSCAKLACAP